MTKKCMVLILMMFCMALPVNAKEIKVEMKGLVCGFCAVSLEKVFKEKESVDDIDVDLDKKLMTIDLKEDQDITDEEIKISVENAGFNIVKIERN